MQNVAQGSTTDNQKLEKLNAHEVGKSSTPQSSNSSPTKSETDTFSELQPRFMSDSSESEEEDVSEVESFMIDQEDLVEDSRLQTSKFLLTSDDTDHSVDPETQARLEALLQAAGIGKLATGDGKHLADPEVLRRLTSSVSCALDEAAAALTRMRSENPRPQPETRSLVEACTDGDVGTVRKLLTEGRSVHETTEEGESLLSLACSAGYYELAQVLLAMHANVEDRGIKGDCTPLMEAASAGFVDIVRLLIAHGADVNAQSSSGNTPLMYACAGGHEQAVRVLLEAGANVEDHNENGHTPLMEAASAGHVSVAKILLEHGAGINTHSNEFKESALTLACYKGHLDMVRFLLEAGADQEHKTDEMHTALMEASMDGHVEVAKLLLDSGAQVNMPTDSFESPLTLAACGGHVDLALLLIDRGANIEEVNDEGYTPLMEAAREGHEEMVCVLLTRGANINAQTEETQETALTLACCGGFLEVADFLIKNGAELELGASTPLMEAAQEGHLELVRYLLEAGADVHAQTQTGDTALTYACENGHTDVADLLLQYGANLEHESEGGRTPLMKACRAGHLCTVQFLISKNADVNRQTTNNDHTPLSLASAGGHLSVVELLLAHNADPFHKLKDNSTMLIEAAKGGHTNVVQLLLDYPHSIMMNSPHTGVSGVGVQPPTGLHEVPEAVRVLPQDEMSFTKAASFAGRVIEQLGPSIKLNSAQKSLLRKNRLSTTLAENNLTSSEAQQVRNPPGGEGSSLKDDPNILDKGSTKPQAATTTMEQQIFQRQQIVEELQRVEQELKEKEKAAGQGQVQGSVCGQLLETVTVSTATLVPALTPTSTSLSMDLSTQGIWHAVSQGQGQLLETVTMSTATLVPTITSTLASLDMDLNSQGVVCGAGLFHAGANSGLSLHNTLYKTDLSATTAAPAPAPHPPISASADVVQTTAISDRPKAKPVSKKEGKNLRKQQVAYQAALQQQHSQAVHLKHLAQINEQLQQQVLQQQQQIDQIEQQQVAVAQQVQAQQQTNQQQRTITTAGALVGTTATKNVFNPGQLMAHIQQQLDPGINLTSPQHLHHQVHKVIHQEKQIRTLQQDAVCCPSCDVLSAPSQRCQLLATAAEEALLAADIGKVKTDQDDFADSIDAITLDDVPNSVVEQEQRLRMRELAAAAYAEGVAFGKEAALTALGAAKSPLQVLSTDQDQVEYFTVPSPTGPVQVQQGPNSFQLQYQVTRQELQQLSEMKARTRMEAVTNTSPFQSQLLLQAPTLEGAGNEKQGLVVVPAGVESHPSGGGVGGGGGTHQVAATQTTPDTKKPSPAPAPPGPTAKGKKARYQLQRVHTATANHPNQTNAPPFGSNFQLDTNSTPVGFTGTETQYPQAPPFSCMDVDSETDSNHDTALTLACAGGHEELVELLLSRGADIEHRDKKGFTPLILAATAGHEKVVEILMNHTADMEAQSERTKDTPLSLACSGGRYEVVELLLSRGANKEHRNVSDYTPLSLAASGGYVNIIKLLLTHGAEINSRTGSKLGISPLMLAAMNGHTAAVKLLLDMGSDINAQIETNRNTALTLACFQGRHEVVSLLLDRKANVEHRAKTGLTPLMEAASGGFVEVGRVLLDKGADVNAPPVPSSRDTALTIAADKGHCRFVELLLTRGAQVEVKNKKGNSPLWLAANGGHLAVVELLYNVGADIDSQDNRKVSCLMAAFRKGHMKVVKWMVNHVTQFPSDQEMTRYISTVSDKELLEKCQDCVKIIRAAKDQQAAKANKNATILLEELDMEKTREESKRAAAARRRERKKKKKLEKKEEKRKLHEENQKNEIMYGEEEEEEEDEDKEEVELERERETSSAEVVGEQSPGRATVEGEEGDSGIDANSQGSCSSNEVKTAAKDRRKEKKKKKLSSNANTVGGSSGGANLTPNNIHPPLESRLPVASTSKPAAEERRSTPVSSVYTSSSMFHTNITTLSENNNNNNTTTKSVPATGSLNKTSADNKPNSSSNYHTNEIPSIKSRYNPSERKNKGHLIFEASRHPADREDFEATGNETYIPVNKGKKASYMNLYTDGELVPSNIKTGSSTSPKQAGKREEGWKEVVRNCRYLNSPFRSKKVSVPLNAISRVIGRGGSNINAIRGATGAHIEVEKQSKGQGERIITIKGSTEAVRQAHNLIVALIKDPDVDILQMLPKSAKQAVAAWDKSVNAKVKNGPLKTTITTSSSALISGVSSSLPKLSLTPVCGSTNTPLITPLRTCVASYSTTSNRVTAPRLMAAAEKRAAQLAAASNTTKTTMSYTTAIMTSNRASKVVTTTATTSSQTFAAKLTAEVTPTLSLPSTMPSTPQLSPAIVANKLSPPISAPQPPPAPSASSPSPPLQSTTPVNTTLEYSLFNDSFTKVAQQSMWGRENDSSQKGRNFASVAGTGAPSNGPVPPPNKYLDNAPPQVDASKAPGYRGAAVCSPVSSKTQNSTTPPSMPVNAMVQNSPYPNFPPSESQPPSQPLAVARPEYTRPVYAEYPPDHSTALLKMVPGTDSSYHSMSYSQPHATTTVTMSRLNPRAPDFSSSMKPQPSQQTPLYNQAPPPATYMAPPHNAILANNNVISFPLGKYAQSRPNGQTRWPYIAHHPYPQPEMMGFTSAHLATLASLGHQAANDLLAGLENGSVGSPNVSPSSPQGQVPSGDHRSIEDRKVPPRPIGTERAWKNYTGMGTGGGEPDMTNASWISWAGSNNMSTLDRHQMYRTSQGPTAAYSRLPITDDLPNIIDTAAYQGGESQHYNGGPAAATALSVMHSMPLLPHYASDMAPPTAAPPDTMKMEAPWDPTRIPIPELQEKQQQHGWTAKWSH